MQVLTVEGMVTLFKTEKTMVCYKIKYFKTHFEIRDMYQWMQILGQIHFFDIFILSIKKCHFKEFIKKKSYSRYYENQKSIIFRIKCSS